MREIKFRFFTNGEMHPDMFLLAGIDNSVPTVNDALNMYPDTIVMQYTGLKDKSGVEIYEGDYIRLNGTGDVVEIKYEESDYDFLFYLPNGGGAMGLCFFKGYKDFEVVGNIHENPELAE